MALIGYARVSTSEQETHLQIDALKSAGVRRIFEDSSSGVGARLRLRVALAALRPGDTLVVWKIDRIARSLADLLSILEVIRQAGASLRSLTEPIDTTSSIGEFTLQILGAVAQLERNLIRERTIAGQRAAVARGAVVGRPAVLSERRKSAVRRRYASGRYTMAALACLEGVSPSVIKRAIYAAQ